MAEGRGGKSAGRAEDGQISVQGAADGLPACSLAWLVVSSRIAESYRTAAAGLVALGEPPVPGEDPRPPAAASGSASRAQSAAAGGGSGSAGTSGTEPDADLPGYCLGHLRSKEDPRGYGPVVRRYELYPVAVPRPARGRTRAVIVCGTCGKGLSWTVSSRARMRRERRREPAAWLAVAVTGAGCCTAFVILLATRRKDPSFPEFLPFLITLVSFMAAVTAVNLMPVEVTGVKLGKGRLHEVRRPGEAMSVEYPSSPYIGPE